MRKINYNPIQVLFALLLLLTLTSISCEKEPPYGYPTCDNCDWDVMTCEIDGVPWQAKIKCEFLGPCDPVTCNYYGNNKFEIWGDSYNKNFSIALLIDITKCNVISDTCNTYLRLYNVFYSEKGVGNCKAYRLDTTVSKFVKILSYDTINKIIEANFGYSAINDCNQISTISKGYFKLSYN